MRLVAFGFQMIRGGAYIALFAMYAGCGFQKFWHADSRNSGILGVGKQGVLQLEMTCSPRGSIEANEPPSLQDTVKDGGCQILVM